MSDESMAQKFGRRVKEEKPDRKFSPDFEVEGYLQYRGDNFVKRFDANSYLYITKALDRFDLANGCSMEKVFQSASHLRFLLIAFKSDWLYPAYQTREIVRACKQAHVDVSYCEINSTYGHDAFLLEVEEEQHFVSNFLRRVSNE
jgi:homoserine O-acetyltransferase